MDGLEKMSQAELLKILEEQNKQIADLKNKQNINRLTKQDFSTNPLIEKVDPNISDVQHPDISLKERLFAKNLSANENEMLNYLKRENPQLLIEKKDGDILVKNPNEKKWSKLDPSKVTFTEALKDLGDIATDLGTSALTAGATFSASPIAGVSAGAGLETLRQAMGKFAGVNKELDPTNIAVSGATGAIPYGVEKAKALYPEIKSGIKNVGSSLLSGLSGVNKLALKGLYKYPDEVENIIAQGFKGADLGEEVIDKLSQSIWQAKSNIGSQIDESLKNANKSINIKGLKTKFLDKINDLENISKDVKSDAINNKINTLKETYNNLFKLGEEEISDNVSAKGLFELQDEFKNLAQMQKLDESLAGSFTNKTTLQKKLKNIGNDLYHESNKLLDEATEGVSADLKSRYKNIAQSERILNKSLTSSDKALSTLKNIDSNAKGGFKKALSNLEKEGIDTDFINKNAEIASAVSTFDNPSFFPISGQGQTSTSRELRAMNIGKKLGDILGEKVGNVTGSIASFAVSPQLTKFYTKSARESGKLLDPVLQKALEVTTTMPSKTLLQMLSKNIGKE